MAGNGNDPFSGSNVRNILEHVLSPKIVSDGTNGYTVALDLINVDNIYATGTIYANGTTGPTGPAGVTYPVLNSVQTGPVALGAFIYNTPLTVAVGPTIPGIGVYNVTLNWYVSVDTQNPGDMIQVYFRGTDTANEPYLLFSCFTTDSSDGTFPELLTLSGLLNVVSRDSTGFNITFKLLSSASPSMYTGYLYSYTIQQVA